MIKKALYYIFLIAGFSLAATAQQETNAEKKDEAAPKLPPASEVIDKYVEAIGGKAAYEKLKTRKDLGKIQIP